jgi:hypothetical protein
MKRSGKRLSALKDAAETAVLVRVERPSITEDRLDGFVVGLSEKLVLLHLLDRSLFLDGYSAVPLRHVETARVLDDHDSFADRALRLRGERPLAQPKVLLHDLASLLSSADGLFPLVTIHAERLHADECYIGRARRMTRTAVELREIDPAARWGRIESYKFRDITRVDFGGRYEDALWQVSEHERCTGSPGGSIP